MLKLISAQPATDYYAWQVEVYLHNFLELGYKAEDIHVVGGYYNEIPESWFRLQNHERFKDVEFFLYEDDREEDFYPPSVQSYILAKHFDENAYLKDCAIFFHDCDFLFTRYFDFTEYLQDDSWYFSDTVSYIGANYIKSKDEAILDGMCQIIGIDRLVVEDNQQNSGGAQKLMKNIDGDYWREVYKNSNELYKYLKTVSHLKKEGDPYGIQIWTASMWAELWTAWKLGHKVVVPKEFDFCWATCPADRWDHIAFFHNAGVPDANQGMFFKADYIDRYPFGSDLNISDGRCSYRYYTFMKSIDSCLV
jgi:hypothetical protein